MMQKLTLLDLNWRGFWLSVTWWSLINTDGDSSRAKPFPLRAFIADDELWKCLSVITESWEIWFWCDPVDFNWFVHLSVQWTVHACRPTVLSHQVIRLSDQTFCHCTTADKPCAALNVACSLHHTALFILKTDLLHMLFTICLLYVF